MESLWFAGLGGKPRQACAGWIVGAWVRGGDVLYVEYRMRQSDQRAFITATDVIKAGTVEMRAYSTVLADEQSKKRAMSRAEGVLAEFGATLKVRSPRESKAPGPP